MQFNIKKIISELYFSHPDTEYHRYNSEIIDNYKKNWNKILKIKNSGDLAIIHYHLKHDYASWLNLWNELNESAFLKKIAHFVEKQIKSFGPADFPDRFLNKPIAPVLFALKMENDLICSVKSNNVNYLFDPYAYIDLSIMNFVDKYFDDYLDKMITSNVLIEFITTTICLKPHLIDFLLKKLLDSKNQQNFSERTKNILFKKINNQNISNAYFSNDLFHDCEKEEIGNNIKYLFAATIIAHFDLKIAYFYLQKIFHQEKIDLLHPYIFSSLLKKLYNDNNHLYQLNFFDKFKIRLNSLFKFKPPISLNYQLNMFSPIELKNLNFDFIESFIQYHIFNQNPIIWLHCCPEFQLKNILKYPINDATRLAVIYQVLLNRKQNFSISGKEIIQNYLAINDFEFLENKKEKVLRWEDRQINPVANQLFNKEYLIKINDFEAHFFDRLYRFFYFCVKNENSYFSLIDPIVEHNISLNRYHEIYFYFSLFDARSPLNFLPWLENWSEKFLIHQNINNIFLPRNLKKI